MKKNKHLSLTITRLLSSHVSMVRKILLFATFGLSVFFMWFFEKSYFQARKLMDQISPNNSFESFSIDVFEFIQPIGWGLTGILILSGLYLIFFKTRSQESITGCIAWLKKQFKRLPKDFAHLWDAYRPHKAGILYLIAVLIIMLAAILFRILFLNYPMRYDESYTVVVFAMRPWLNLISDYSLPNNHIFHTVLVKIAMILFGSAPRSVRMPAFISGILCVPAGYLLARQLYGRKPALMSAGLIAALPMLISYSTNARGYSQYILFSLVLFSLAIYLSKHANLVGWGLFVLTGAAGFYTVPFMLFPFGAVCLWILGSALFGETRQAYAGFGRLLKYLISAGLMTGLLTMLVYLPVILIGTGFNSLVGNPFVTPLSYSDLWVSMGEQIQSTWMNWNYDLPLAIQIVLAVGVCLSLLFHARISRVKVPLPIVLATWIVGLLVLLRRNPLDRIWLFLMPFWLIWACGGFLMPLNLLRLHLKRLQTGLVVGSLIITAYWSFQRVHTYFPGWQADPGKVELASEYLSQNLIPGDAIAVIFPYDAPYWYYLKQFGVKDEYMHQINLEQHERVFAVVTEGEHDSPVHVLQSQGLLPEDYQIDEASMEYRINDQEIYLFHHR